MIKIVIADDHPIVRRGIIQILKELQQDTLIDEVSNASDLLKKVGEEDFDLIILDIKMPGRSGLDILADLKDLEKNIPILVLSMHSEEQYAIRAIKYGASGYVTKDSAPDELIIAVERILKGGKYITNSLAERMAENLQIGGERVLHDYLSNRETEVFKKIAEGKSPKLIAEDLFISEKTVSTYRTRILEKMKMSTTAQLIRYAVENGLVD